MAKLGLLLIRADANAQMGTGHVMRCLALAQAWLARGGRVLLASADRNLALEPRLQGEGLELAVLSVQASSDADAASTVALAGSRSAIWTVLDGYHFGSGYQQKVLACARSVLMLDDYVQSDRFYATVLLNQNLHADRARYERVAPGVRLLLGNKYALLRREFWAWRGKRRAHSGALRRILVTLGGGDADNVTAKIISGLGPLSELGVEVLVLVGANNPHGPALQAQSARLRLQIRLERNVSDMPGALAECDLAICGGGATCWEMAFFGIPMLPVILAANQQPIAESLDTADVAQSLGWHDELRPEKISDAVRALAGDPGRLMEMSRNGQGLVDGWGVERVLDVLTASS